MSEQAYVGRKPCGCAVACMVIDPENKKHAALRIASWIRSGLTIETVSVKDIHDGKVLKRCRCASSSGAGQVVAEPTREGR
jgi:hypothetical protein